MKSLSKIFEGIELHNAKWHFLQFQSYCWAPVCSRALGNFGFHYVCVALLICIPSMVKEEDCRWLLQTDLNTFGSISWAFCLDGNHCKIPMADRH